MTSIAQLLAHARNRLAPSHTAALDARLLLAHAMQTTQEYLLAHPEAPPAPDAIQHFQTLLDRRIAHEPMAYILGSREFWGRDFSVGPGVLIPRPDTETLIETILTHHRPTQILEFGTGSGCILLTLLAECPQAHATGVDCSPVAIHTTRTNAAHLGLESRLTLHLGEWDAPLPPDQRADVIVSNPPYIEAQAKLPPDVAQYEPHEALFAGPDGLEAYRAIAALVPRRLNPGGLLALEIGAGQSDAVSRLMTPVLPWQASGAAQDLAGITRVLWWRHAEGDA